MELTEATEARILELYHQARGHLPPVSRVAVRPNVRRLASIGVAGEGGRALNLATAVVRAGEPAWRLIGPALAGHRASLLQLRALTREEVTRTRSSPRASGQPGRKGRSPHAPRCQGSEGQRGFLRELVESIRHASGHGALFPAQLHLRISTRMTRALGSTSVRGEWSRITIAERLFRPGLEDILWETVKHEVAHLLDHVTRPDGRISHGPSWRRWARELNARPERLCTPDEAVRIEIARQGEGSGRTWGPGRGPNRIGGSHRPATGLSELRHPATQLRYPTPVRDWVIKHQAGPSPSAEEEE